MTSSKGVPCPFPLCKGKLVSLYIRCQHVAKFCCPVDGRAGVAQCETSSPAETVPNSQVSVWRLLEPDVARCLRGRGYYSIE